MKRRILLLLAAALAGIMAAKDQEPLHHDPWALILYRPQNYQELNEIRCWLRLEDEDGNDVTYSAAKATYEWASVPDVVNYYRNTYYLSGGMAMHLNLRPGKYRISVYTPPEQQYGFTDSANPNAPKRQWESNVFSYDTANPAKVLFVFPTANENGFYDGGWVIDYKAPKYVRQGTLPRSR